MRQLMFKVVIKFVNQDQKDVVRQMSVVMFLVIVVVVNILLIKHVQEYLNVDVIMKIQQ